MGDRYSDDYKSSGDFKEDWRRTIYCGGLRYETDEDAVKSFFQNEYGAVSSVKIITGDQGSSKGYCFVTFVDESDAHDALQTGTGKVVDGAPIRINVARAHLRSQFQPRGRGRGNFGYRRFSDRDGPSYRNGGGSGGRDYSPDDRYSPPPRGRSRSPIEYERKRRRRSPSGSRSRSRTPRRGRNSRSPPLPRSLPQSQLRQSNPPPAQTQGFQPLPTFPPPAVAPVPTPAAAAAVPAALPPAPPPLVDANVEELERLRQSDAERAARVRKLEGELERERIMSHELEAELNAMHTEGKSREEALRRHRDLLTALNTGVGRLVAARQELKIAEEGLASLYAEAASYLERTADVGRRRRSDAIGKSSGVPLVGAGGGGGGSGTSNKVAAVNGDHDTSDQGHVYDYQQQYQQQYQGQQYQQHDGQQVQGATAGEAAANGSYGEEGEEGGWRDVDLSAQPVRFKLG